MSDSPKGLRAALAEEAVAEQLADSNTTIEGYPYRVTLHNGVSFVVISKVEPAVLASKWQKARSKDEVIAWNTDQFSEARQVAHIEIMQDEEDGDDGDYEDEGVLQAEADGGGEAAPKTAAKPAGLSAAAGIRAPHIVQAVASPAGAVVAPVGNGNGSAA